MTYETRRKHEPKRAQSNPVVKILNMKGEFKPHHQKTLLLEVLIESKDKSLTLKEIVDKIDGDKKLWERLQSKQTTYNCVVYHMKDLEKSKVLEVK